MATTSTTSENGKWEMENSVANQLTTEKSSKTFSAINRRQFDSHLVWQSTRLDTHSFTHSHTHSFTHLFTHSLSYSFGHIQCIPGNCTIYYQCTLLLLFSLLATACSCSCPSLLCSRLSAIKLALCFPDSLASTPHKVYAAIFMPSLKLSIIIGILSGLYVR